jgi:hypothetical protein
MSDFSAALRDALLIDDVTTSEETVRQVVINQIRELDPEATPRSTGYFNHSWVPDLTIRWGDTADRNLFLRFDVVRPGFLADLKYTGDTGAPVFLDIAQPDIAVDAANVAPTSARPASEETLKDANAMVTEHRALGQLGRRVSSDPDVRQATKQIVRGGRGFVDTKAAENVADYYQLAADIVQPQRVVEADPKELREVLDLLEESLSRVASLDLETELRSRWVRAGREPEDFPSLEDWELADRSPDEIANLVMALLTSDDEVPDKRWREIAGAISMDALGYAARGRARVVGGKMNDLLRVAHSLWAAKWVWVGPLDPGSRGSGTLDWSIGGTSIELYLDTSRAVFVDNGTRLNTLDHPDELPFLEPRLATLDDPRAKGITVVTPEESVALHLRASATETLGERLRQLMAEQADVRIAGRIEALEIQAPGSDETVQLRFDNGKVHADHPIPIAALARIVAQFMAALPNERLLRLDEQFSPTQAS